MNIPSCEACCMILRASATPDATAESCCISAPTASASRYAIVVFPVPAGPHRMSEGRWPPSSSEVSAFPGPNRWRCPTSSSKLRGRIRVASGAPAIVPTGYPGEASTAPRG